MKIGKDFHDGVKRCIPSEFTMISAADDSQEAQEAYSTAAFDQLPNPNGKEGGACTSSFLNVCYDNAYKIDKLSWVNLLKQMQGQIKDMGLDQEPQLSSSRMINVDRPMGVVPPDSGKRRALLIGINYVGQGSGELKAPHNDTRNLLDYLVNVCGFAEKECLVMMDDGEHPMPTRKNIEDAFERIARYSQPNDVVFISFSGHGGQIEDTDGDESDGMDESLIPVDFKEAGQIVDDDILKNLIKPMAEGVHVTMLMDCCHSGTVADLPYKIGANDTEYQIERGFDMRTYAEIHTREVEEKKARGEFVEEEKAEKEYLADPLPYNPEHGFVVRPAAKPEPPADEEEETTDNDKKKGRWGKNKKNQKKKKNKKDKDAPPTPPPQCTVS